MLNKSILNRDQIVVITLETLMPKEHFLRDLEKYVDFSFIYERVSHLYSNIGRKSIDPVLLVKMLLLGFLYGIDSERKLVKEVEVNIAFRWFLGIGLDCPVIDHSTISQTRRRKWRGTNIFEDIFTEIVQKCIAVGLVDGKLILTDSTHVKANAASKRRESVTITKEPSEYLKKLDELCEQEDLKVRADAISKGLKKRGYESDKTPKSRKIVKSTTDPDCGLLNRPGKPNGFHYLNHQSIDGKSGIITDVFVTPANIKDFEPYVNRIKHQMNRYNFRITEVGIDRMYDQEEIHKEMYDLHIKTYTPLIDTEPSRHYSSLYAPSDFTFDDKENAYICPNDCRLKYSYVNKSRRKKVYRASQNDCKNCTLKDKCIEKNLKSRTLETSFARVEMEAQRANYGTKRYYEVQRKRRTYCEGNFAIQKDNHNLRRTRKRGNVNVTEHCLFSALALNLKRLIHYLKSKSYPRKIIRFLKFERVLLQI